VEVFVEGLPLERGQVEGDGVGVVGVLAQQVVAAQMVFGELDQLLRGWVASLGEDLAEDVAADLLYPYFIVTSLGGDCSAPSAPVRRCPSWSARAFAYQPDFLCRAP